MFVDLVNNDDVLKAVQMRGPLIPMEIRKYLGKGDSITIGAALSTLVSKGLIKNTHVKMGGSPFYYVKGQEAKLEILEKYLNEKDKKTFQEIKEIKILKDNELDPLTRVSLRNIPDFAKRIELTNTQGEIKLFWRWYLITEEEAVNKITGKKQEQEIIEEPQEKKQEIIEEEKEETKIIQDRTREEPREEIKKEEEKPTKREKTNTKEQTIIDFAIPEYEDEFYKTIKRFFQENQIKIKKAKQIRKNSEYELIILVKTPFGNAEYYCKAKSKKKCNEGDLSSAYLQGQNRRLPTIFLTTGEITKKAKEKINEDYKGLMIKEI